MTSSETVTHDYDAATAPRGMLRHVLPVLNYPRVIADNTTLIGNFFRRDLLGRFRGSFLGIFWVLIQPIFMFAIYFFVFGYLFAPQRIGGVDPSVPFALYLFGGIIVFNSFVEATTRCCGTVMENANLVKKVAFPCELLPLPIVLVSLIVYGVGALIFVIVGFATDQLTLGTHMLAWPLVVLVQMIFTLGVGMILATLQVLLRDTSHLYAIASQAWFFLSPVFWPHALLEGKLGESSWVLLINPMYPLVQAHRQSLGYGAEQPMMALTSGEPLPDVWFHLGLSAAWAIFFLVVGYSFFTSRKNKFADLV